MAGMAVAMSLSGCLWFGGTSTPRSNTSASASASLRTSPIPIGRLPEDQARPWAALKATIVPPDGFPAKPDVQVPVANHVGGPIDDATARRWAASYLRENQWEMWAEDNLQTDGFLFNLGPQDNKTQTAVFGDDYGFMNSANRAGGTLDVHFLHPVRFTAVRVPADVKTALVQSYGYPGPVPDFALLVDLAGPGSWVLKRPDGSDENLQTFPDGYQDRAFVVGELKDYPGTLGEVWYLHTYSSCARNDYLRAACAQ